MQVAIFALLCLAAHATEDLNFSKQQWNTFKLTHGKKYNTKAEEVYRLGVFRENINEIKEHNELFERGLTSYTLRENQFTDLTHEEYLETVLRYSNQNSIVEDEVSEEDPHLYDDDNDGLPQFVHWGSNGAVTPVKNEWKCKASWSFSVIGALEGQYSNKYGFLREFSAQNLIDCVTENYGCQGGDAVAGYEYMKQNGTAFEGVYRYTGIDGQCRSVPAERKVKIRDFVTLERGNEQELKRAVANVGPISVTIDASHKKFRHFHEGVFDEERCAKRFSQLNHNVLVVGYGTTCSGQKVWFVKNSWGRKFGESGYILMARNKNNQCGIATRATYPILHD